MQDSIVVEMTPKMRTSIPQWTLDALTVSPPILRTPRWFACRVTCCSIASLFHAAATSAPPTGKFTRFEKFEVRPDGKCTVDSDTSWKDIRSN